MRMMRAVFVILLSCLALAQDTKYPPDSEQIPGPAAKTDTAQWRVDVEHWRAEQRIRIGYDPRELSASGVRVGSAQFRAAAGDGGGPLSVRSRHK